MQAVGGKGARKPYYIMMKKRASELNDSSMKFLAYTDVLKNNLAAIPEMPDAKNYVDRSGSQGEGMIIELAKRLLQKEEQ